MSTIVSPAGEANRETDVSVQALDAEVEGALETSDEEEGQSGDGDRQRRISEAAYRRAEGRGFAPGQELDDWLEAERELERE